MMNQNREHTLFVEKYRPVSLENYIGNQHLKTKVSKYINTGDIPHLLLHGKAGTGKTTLAKLLVSNIDCDQMYINASDTNSVDTVRNQIKVFASSVGFKDLKVIILDECDFLTPNAQAALRNLMETFSRHCRFILTCNYVERIIDPIQSRCQSYQIIPPSKKEVAIHTSKILNTEGITYDNNDIVVTFPPKLVSGVTFLLILLLTLICTPLSLLTNEVGSNCAKFVPGVVLVA